MSPETVRSTLNAYSYTYDNIGNRLTMTVGFGTHNYTYDNLYRLTNATLPTETFAYDQVGNRNPASFVYDAANRLLDDGTYTYTYDDNGNLITKTNKSNPTNTTTYTYNIENQLISVVHGLSTVDYKYDGLGRRIEKNVNGTITRYVYDNEDIIAEYDGSNNLIAKYLHGPGIDEPLRMTRGGQNYFYHADGLGSITSLTNSTGVVAKTYRYDAFGNIVSQTGTLVNPFTYTGRELDTETGLYYYRARYYDSRIGRFLQEDRFLGLLHQPQSLNLYAYVMNNSVNYSDPLGYARGDWWDPRTYIDISFSGSSLGKGTSLSRGGKEQGTLTFFTVGGASLDIMIGALPTTCDLTVEVGLGLGDYLGAGFFFGRPNKIGNFDVGGIAVHLGIGLGSPVYVSGTYPLYEK